MRLLLDTCTFIWIAADAPELSAEARRLFEDPSNEAILSSVSAWEIAVKHARGRLPLPEPPERYVPALRRKYSVAPLPLAEEATLHLPLLPRLHKDPFDRMLVCQAIVHGMVILTPDKLITQYSVRIAW